ncbi:hypothetical protein OPQ81_006788 [Rhizoctonia solani]|nr:hypothetical protein OPQ81_006788 [Rhizoctonia solani]
MRHNGNLHSEFRHPITQPNPYSIPEPQIGFGNRWDLASGMSANLSCGHGIQSMLSDYTQPPPSTNPPVNATSDYTHPQHFETTLQQRYVSSELPADPYSQLDPPNRQWTQEVWGNQEFSLPLRTDSPKPLESPLTDRASSESQETVMFTSMPNHHDYVRPQGFNGA